MTTVTEDQHRMTSRSQATAAQEVLQPSRTQGVNLVLSEPMCTAFRPNTSTKDGPLRSMSTHKGGCRCMWYTPSSLIYIRL